MNNAPKVARHRAYTKWQGLLTLAIAALLAAPAIAGPPAPTPTALRPLTGDSDSYAVEINNRGHVAGRSVGDVTTGVVWNRRGDATMLMPLPGNKSSLAEGINNRGQVVGYSRSGKGKCGEFGVDTAVIWNLRPGGKSIVDDGLAVEEGRLPAMVTVQTELTPLPGDDESRAFAVSDSGYVIGTSLGPRGVGVPGECEAIFTPVIWDKDGNPTELPALPGFAEGFAQDVNNQGRVAGGSIDFTLFPFLTATTWNKNAHAKALNPPAGYFDSAANSINNRGAMAGETFDFGGNDMAVIWDKKGNASALRPLAGSPESTGQGINNRGFVVGHSGSELFFLTSGTATLWNDRGRPTALAPLAGDTDSFAWGINDANHVVGQSRDAGGTNTAVIWK